eukprot:CAMPEP_0171484428 /NCGR_PEP_ID=MMETSP0946-20130122/8808_1 /TAXON_ID=109269 /ORGANISM="Vaucheria litorea, Strain CCMP2940" /LENGTH=400 /DNA_ID=CAMNT_0012017135 /DNA_START=58 /DNA_END=1261 /DNA_ORIENTATION=-
MAKSKPTKVKVAPASSQPTNVKKANPSTNNKKKNKKNAQKIPEKAPLSQVPSKKRRAKKKKAKLPPPSVESEESEEKVESLSEKSASDVESEENEVKAESSSEKPASEIAASEKSASDKSVSEKSESSAENDDSPNDQKIDSNQSSDDEALKPVGHVDEEISENESDSGDEEPKQKKRNAQDEAREGHSKLRKLAPRFLHVRNISFKATADEVQELFKEQGNCEVVSYPMEDGNGLGFAVLKCEKFQDLENCAKLDKTEFRGRLIYLDKVLVMPGIFVRYSPETADEDIKEKFSKCGAIANIDIKNDEEGKSRGICLIKYDSEDAIWKALLLNRTELNGEKLKVALSYRNSKGELSGSKGRGEYGGSGRTSNFRGRGGGSGRRGGRGGSGRRGGRGRGGN